MNEMSNSISDAALQVSRDLVRRGSLRHLALTADGNGRWAERKGLPRVEGHLASKQSFRQAVETLSQISLPYFSIHVFSPENWSRRREEIAFIVNLVSETLMEARTLLAERQVRFVWSGREEGVPSDLVGVFRELERATSGNEGMVLQFCFNYGGREEIVDSLARSDIEVGDDPKTVEVGYQKFVPDVDLYIRTGGEKRISNFQLWKLAYAELLFLDTPWPEVGSGDILSAIAEYGHRVRTFGNAG